jgi:hypothetical protein
MSLMVVQLASSGQFYDTVRDEVMLPHQGCQTFRTI